MITKLVTCHSDKNLFRIYCILLFITLGLKDGLPSEVIIIGENGEEVSEIVGPLDEGSKLSLVCQTNGVLPSVLTWWKGSSLLDDSFVNLPQGVTQNELVFPRLYRSDLMTSFKCKAMAPNVTQPSETSVSIDLNLKPLDVHIVSLQRPLSAGREVNLTCQSSGSRPPAVLTWWKGSKQLLPAQNISSNGLSTSILPFVPSMTDNGKGLSCRASNPIMDGKILEDYRLLNVYYVPQLLVTVGTPRPNIQEGDDVYFDCNIQANPSVSEVAWRFNEKSVYSNLLAGIKVHNQSLLLRHVTRRNTGNYSCVAANVEGENSSHPVFLNVQYVPYCLPNQQTAYGVPMEQTIEVKCEVGANPENVNFQWYLNSSITQMPIKTFITNGTQSTAFFTPKKPKDYGYIICRAQNIVGIQKEPCCFKITPASVPETVQNCEVINQTTSSIIVSCEPGNGGGLQQRFHLELYSTRGLHASVIDFKVPIFHVTDLPSGISYIAVVYATNSQGRSNSVALIARTQPYPGSQTDARPLLVSPILAVLIVIIGVLVLIAIVVVIGTRNRGSGQSEVQENPANPYLWEQPLTTEEIKPGQQYI